MTSATSAPALTGILETSIYVEDLERSTAFYQRLFGFERLFTEASHIRVLAVAPGQVLLIFKKGAARQPVTTPGGTIPGHDGDGQLHFALAIPKEALAGWEARLKAQGIAIESRVTWPRGGVSLYFRDPDRHVVELATPGLWANY